ncbi:MAG: outer membrane protein assembly factor BamE [Alphaproteobacteria bacterium]
MASCTPIVDNRGHSTQESDFQQIVPGTSKQADVETVLGTPSARSSFGDDTWYYITEEEKTVGMFAPHIAEQKVVAIRFDANQTVAEVAGYNKSQAENVQMVAKTTPSEGHEMTFMEQMLSNFGRFNAPSQIDPRNFQK